MGLSFRPIVDPVAFWGLSWASWCLSRIFQPALEPLVVIADRPVDVAEVTGQQVCHERGFVLRDQWAESRDILLTAGESDAKVGGVGDVFCWCCR
ncbi:MAG: hypothetical protein A3E01_02890 [Gammaproteobacteria bacterium RIFCSPHIGHO2_12_FULL_63_22]|nr:MAG: hypothetical protein A3E01_02890 [Gammaproteobacteria bacterium RIFCSPHIGHO2_12_FULL_63_22]